MRARSSPPPTPPGQIGLKTRGSLSKYLANRRGAYSIESDPAYSREGAYKLTKLLTSFIGNKTGQYKITEQPKGQQTAHF